MRLNLLRKKSNVTDRLILNYLNRKYHTFLEKTDEDYPTFSTLKSYPEQPFKTHTQNWDLIKIHRRIHYLKIPITGKGFRVYITPEIQNQLFKIQQFNVAVTPKVTFPNLEELIRGIRQLPLQSLPDDKTIKTVYSFLKESPQPPLTKEFIQSINQILDNKKESPSRTDLLRSEDYFHHMSEGKNKRAPSPHLLEDELEQLCKFLNHSKRFIPPLIKGVIAYFILCFLQPFRKNNALTAYFLFLAFLERKHQNIAGAPLLLKTVYHSFQTHQKVLQNALRDENDLTYTIYYALSVVKIAQAEYLQTQRKKERQKREYELLAQKIIKRGHKLRQAELIADLLTEKESRINITQYAKKGEIVRQTARKDLNELKKEGWLKECKKGRNIWFKIPKKDALKAKILQT